MGDWPDRRPRSKPRSPIRPVLARFLDRWHRHPEPCVVAQIRRAGVKLRLDPVHRRFVFCDDALIGVTEPARPVALPSEPLGEPVMALALVDAGDVLAQVAVESRAVVVLAGALARKLAAGRAQHV